MNARFFNLRHCIVLVLMSLLFFLSGCAVFGTNDGDSSSRQGDDQQQSSEEEETEIQTDLNITPGSIMNKNSAKGADAEDPDEKKKR